MANMLYYCDNLPILRERIPSASVDLIYLDPPFNSSRSYNVLFKSENGSESDAQITAFEDTWHWNHAAEEAYYHLVTRGPDRIAKMIAAMRNFIGDNQVMAYLTMMTVRLVAEQEGEQPVDALGQPSRIVGGGGVLVTVKLALAVAAPPGGLNSGLAHEMRSLVAVSDVSAWIEVSCRASIRCLTPTRRTKAPILPASNRRNGPATYCLS